ncbi:hypothetical protein QBC42DRAFT_45504 [Cladorrhinum samala]|uniref:DUF1742-domain-containing protein n=1 Tax=Cladorrhinum samala TaxID=585594 RepID=A0AAV9HXB8_9PEZI|nr:hypothetical protein QBC42DRAFT_45504 [Cladorrhinum samala]
MAFPNKYTHRKVAETSAKSCEVCFKPSTSVLITDDSKDWFYVCPGHLKDSGFCTPKIDHAAIEARKKKELDEEIERVKKEYEEKQKKKKEKDSKNDKEKEKEKEKEKDSKDGDDKDKEKDMDKGKTDTSSMGTSASPANNNSNEDEEEPRIFELKATFYQQRINKKRQAEIAKRNRERLRDPSYFPSVPKNLP